MHDAMVPATPPEKRLKSFIREAVMVPLVATRVEPPRHVDLPPRRIRVVLDIAAVLLLLAPPSGMLVIDDVDVLHRFVCVG